ncbi:hypothetical protein BMS3Bbin07_01045 [bacterium BMS3Bbin07]|nr:hypothetical protein BMS3Bbin07_01045 [bacterium BMS3Bbin07]
MQKDMHYHGVYVLARAAGIERESAQIIATASQFVDDAVTEEPPCAFTDGSKIFSVVTAHHALSIENINKDDQRMVWVPFHFLPGAEGESFTEKLICKKNSKTAKQMVTHTLSKAKINYARELVGITAHVLADTFSHYGFSGVSSRWNRVINDRINVSVTDEETKNYIEGKAKNFFEKYKSGIYENIRTAISFGIEQLSGALGHGAVATYPDRPYLKWNFIYERTGKVSRRDNQETFLEACRKLFSFFKNFATERPEYRDKKINLEFEDIKGALTDILAFEGKLDDRCRRWNKAVRDNSIYVSSEQGIPQYSGQKWIQKKVRLNGKKHADLNDIAIYRYFKAADHFRFFILRDLLSNYNMYVI